MQHKVEGVKLTNRRRRTRKTSLIPTCIAPSWNTCAPFNPSTDGSMGGFSSLSIRKARVDTVASEHLRFCNLQSKWDSNYIVYDIDKTKRYQRRSFICHLLLQVTLCNNILLWISILFLFYQQRSLYSLIWDLLSPQINIWTTTTWSNVWVFLPKLS